MKKSIMMAVAMFAAVTANAQQEGSVNISITPTAEQDYMFYASPNDVEGEDNKVQKIVTGADYIWSSPTYRMQHFLVECLAAPADFQKGLTTGVTPLDGATLSAQLPAGAKVTGLALPGWLHTSSAPDRVNNLNAFVYAKNLDADGLQSVPYVQSSYTNYKRMLDNADNGYIPVIAQADKQFCTIDAQTAENPYCLKLQFNEPFKYTGQYINLAIDLIPTSDSGVESAASNGYGAVFDFQLTKAAEQLATVYHTIRVGGTLNTEFTFYSGCEDDIMQMITSNPYMAYMGLTTDKATQLLNYFNFQANTLPAFQLTYFTNDIRGRVADVDGNPIVEDITADGVDATLQPNGLPLISLYDETAQCYVVPDGVEALNEQNSAEVNADGTFAFTNLDPEHSYRMMAASGTCGQQEVELTFDGIQQQGAPRKAEATAAQQNDLVCDIVMTKAQQITTGVNAVSARAQVAGVTYYNAAGMSSNKPFEGLNIVVTRYTDGKVNSTKAVY